MGELLLETRSSPSHIYVLLPWLAEAGPAQHPNGSQTWLTIQKALQTPTAGGNLTHQAFGEAARFRNPRTGQLRESPFWRRQGEHQITQALHLQVHTHLLRYQGLLVVDPCVRGLNLFFSPSLPRQHMPSQTADSNCPHSTLLRPDPSPWLSSVRTRWNG